MGVEREDILLVGPSIEERDLNELEESVHENYLDGLITQGEYQMFMAIIRDEKSRRDYEVRKCGWCGYTDCVRPNTGECIEERN